MIENPQRRAVDREQSHHAAGKLVLPPGCRVFVLELFDQMHYGAESTVAAMALVQAALALPAAWWLCSRSTARR